MTAIPLQQEDAAAASLAGGQRRRSSPGARQIRHAGAIAEILGCARKDQDGLLGALIWPIVNPDSKAHTRDRLLEAVADLGTP